MNKLYKNFKDTFIFLKGHYRLYFIGILGIAVLNASSAMIEAYLLKGLLDIGAMSNLGTSFKILIGLVIYVGLMVLLLPIFTFMFNGQAKYGFGNICKAIYGKLNRLPVDYYEKQHSGHVLSLFENDTWVVATIFMRHFRRTITAFVTIIIYLIPMFIFDYRITSIILILNLLTLVVNMQLSKRLKRTKKEAQEKEADLTTIVGDVISGISIIRMYELGNYISAKFKRTNKEEAQCNYKNSKISAMLSAYNFIISMCNILVFVVLGTFMVKRGLTTYGNIIGIMSLQTALDANFREFAQYYPQFYNSFAGTERIYEFLNEEEEPLKREIQEIKNPDYIQFQNVNFGYREDKLILENFNLSIREGETLAIIGESGSGKSSLAKLLMGFYSVNSGGIAIGGKNMGDLTLKEIREMIAYVPQETALFNTSIKENIRYGNPNATDEQIIAAAQAAYADGFILEQPQGYETIVGERGIRLSGGQCQRIGIARAILKNAPILILDEATSALDSESEAFIKQAIEDYGKTRTTLIIAHRLSTIENADRVFNMSARM